MSRQIMTMVCQCSNTCSGLPVFSMSGMGPSQSSHILISPLWPNNWQCSILWRPKNLWDFNDYLMWLLYFSAQEICSYNKSKSKILCYIWASRSYVQFFITRWHSTFLVFSLLIPYSSWMNRKLFLQPSSSFFYIIVFFSKKPKPGDKMDEK